MSGEELAVEPAALRRHATEFSEGGERLRGVFAGLSATLSAAGRCWGDDAVGQQFERGYEEPRQAALESFTRLPGALEDIRSRLHTMAKNYEAAEEAATVKD
ncbi:MAG TPA: WXG100 family type VII secretion target [Streptosporangiaceae bacterium]|nr:WXG100 family type VII secretion target [Streptosporangiaceae bacterium]